VASVQTLVRRLDKVDAPDLIVIDEAHRAAASTYQRIVAHVRERNPRVKVVGLTASPQRTDGKGLSDLFDTLVYGPSVRWLIDAGYLADYELLAPPSEADVSAVKTRAGDYAKDELEAAVDKPAIIGDAVSHYLRLARGKRCAVFCVSRKHSRHVCEQYLAAGVPAEHVDGETPSAERKAIVARFMAGETLVLCSVELFIEGFDCPGIEVVQMLRPTQSVVVYLQAIGRALRPAPGKAKALILDHVKNWERHGLPDDDREWSLEGRPKGKRKAGEQVPALSIMQCPAPCFAIFKREAGVCPKCGRAVEGGRRELETVDGELEAIDTAALRRERKREQGGARTLEDLVRLGVRRGLKKPSEWAAITQAARAGRKPRPDEFQQARALLAAIEDPLENSGGVF
jgi:superfamily II DNA or RNA helicase